MFCRTDIIPQNIPGYFPHYIVMELNNVMDIFGFEKKY